MPTGKYPIFAFPNFPEQAIAPWVASNWAKQQNAVIIILDESLARAEEKGEDLTAIQKSLFEDLNVEFYLWDIALHLDTQKLRKNVTGSKFYRSCYNQVQSTVR